jgi:hypothetical protein
MGYGHQLRVIVNLLNGWKPAPVLVCGAATRNSRQNASISQRGAAIFPKKA